MNTLVDRNAFQLAHAILFARYPGIDRILTPEKITAYDRGEYDDLDALIIPAMELIGATSEIIVEWCNWIAAESTKPWPDESYEWAIGTGRVRQYEAELISRYKAGLL